jgi:acyl carrier protein
MQQTTSDIDRSELLNRIARLLSARVNLEVSSPHADLFAAGMDSLMFVDLLLGLEVEFGIKCSLDGLEPDNFRTPARIADYVESRCADQRLPS